MLPDNLRAGFSHRTGEAAQEEVAKLRLQKEDDFISKCAGAARSKLKGWTDETSARAQA
jgi:hypothetical protein